MILYRYLELNIFLSLGVLVLACYILFLVWHSRENLRLETIESPIERPVNLETLSISILLFPIWPSRFVSAFRKKRLSDIPLTRKNRCAIRFMTRWKNWEGRWCNQVPGGGGTRRKFLNVHTYFSYVASRCGEFQRKFMQFCCKVG